MVRVQLILQLTTRRDALMLQDTINLDLTKRLKQGTSQYVTLSQIFL